MVNLVVQLGEEEPPAAQLGPLDSFLNTQSLLLHHKLV